MGLPPLTTLPKVKNYLRAEIGPGGETLLQDLIDVASREIRRHTRRRFEVPRVMESRTFRTYGFGSVYVPEVEGASAITSVTDTSGLAVDYDMDDFSQRDAYPKGVKITLREPARAPQLLSSGYIPADHANLFATELNSVPLGIRPGFPEKIVVTGTFGYERVPPEIEFQARRCVSIWWKEEAAHYTQDAGISRGRRFDFDDLPPLIIAALRDWVFEEVIV